MAVEEQIKPETLEFIGELAQQLRVDSIRCSTKAGSGHPTSSMSAADLMAVLMTRHLQYDFSSPHEPNNDHLIFSKGHASPLLYAIFKAAGAISDEELMSYRQFGSRLQGHPTPALPWVDVATGSLGQGLPIGVGVALAGKKLDKLPYHVWVLCGDSELAEGSIWEAFDKASYYGLSNLTAILDINRLGQRGETEYGWNTDVYRQRVEAFGCRATVIDGHSLEEIDKALADARTATGAPTVVVAKTIKGKGFSEVENKDDWHGKALPEDMAERAIKELGGNRKLTVQVQKPEPGQPAIQADGAAIELPKYQKAGEEKVATRKAYGDALKALGANPKVVATDGEVNNSTYSKEFAKAYPDRYFEMFISEQQMVSAAVGLSVRGYIPFASTFAAFFTRAYDFVRMAAVSNANIRLVGSHAGVEIGEDGPSQMGLEDLGAMRAVHGSTVLYPSDATSAAALTKEMADRKGVVYMRTTRGGLPVIYDQSESFPIGGSKVVRQTGEDDVTLIGAGYTLHSCLKAADELQKDGVKARVIDLYTVKPVDEKTLVEAAGATSGLVVVEDHYPEGGIGEAVMECFASRVERPRIAHLAVQGLPTSGKTDELMEAAGISVKHIVEAAKTLIKSPPSRPHAVGKS